MAKEGSDLRHRELFDGHITGVAFLPGHELQEKFQTVAIAVQSVRTQRTLTRHEISKEPMQGLRQCGCC
jgi:hypothetical protein